MNLIKRLPLAVAVAAMSSQVSAQALEEVIVTAQKRAENLQDVPISVSTMSGEKIQEHHPELCGTGGLCAQPAHRGCIG